jgi:uncharacterized membrane protein (DUF4010 family)
MNPQTVALDSYVPGIAIALAIGLLIGAEREWSQRYEKTERVMAGIRTFGLLGLLGAVAIILTDIVGDHAWAFVLVAVALLVVAGYIAEARATGDWGMTTEVAMLVTFGLGVMAASGQLAMAAGLGVLVAGLLSLKRLLHTQVHRLTPEEVSGALKLLFISVVMLPLLPNESYGPYEVFNPYVIWWMVVAITGLGFAAYVSMRVIGQQSGILLTSVLGGLVSSTAMTLTLARLAKTTPHPSTLSAGLLLSSALMFPRVLVVSAVVAPSLMTFLLWPLVLASLCYLSGAAWLAWVGQRQLPAAEQAVDTGLQNPFQIGQALRFTLILVVIMFAVEVAREYFGQAGVWITAAISGAADVDAINLSLSRIAGKELGLGLAAQGILIAAMSNSVFKLVLSWTIGGNTIGWRTLPFVVAGVVVAAVSIGWLTI